MPMIALNETEILGKNPRVNAEQLAKVRAIRNKLRETGLVGKPQAGYKLEPPFSRSIRYLKGKKNN